MYRPTVRYDDLFKTYVDQVFKSTTLDRNQIIRLALFSAPFNKLFQHQLKKHMTSPLPPAAWEVTDHGLWMDREFIKDEERGKDVNGNQKEICIIGEQPGQIERPAREVCERRIFKQTGGITIKIG